MPNKLIAADYSNIEGRALAWEAGEQWKVDAFRAYDTILGYDEKGEPLRAGPDLYIQSYCRTFGAPLFSKEDPRRKIGKVLELASGYQGGHGAYIKFGAAGELLEKLARVVRAAAEDAEWEEARRKFNPKSGHGLDHEGWTALRVAIDRWRSAHPKTRQFWYDMEESAIEAVESSGRNIKCGKFLFRKHGSFLFLRLPSGRSLCYPYPSIRENRTPWGVMRPQLTFKSVPNQSNKGRIVDDSTNTSKWARMSTYGGALVENVTQAVARDILAEALPRLEAAGYPVILTVHDEIVSEVPKNFGSVEEFGALMCELPPWAEGFPIAAEGWEGERYRK